MGVTLYCFVFGVVSLRTVAVARCRSKPKAVYLFRSLFSVSFHGRANFGPPPEDQDAAGGDPSAVGHLQTSCPITGPSLPHLSLTGCLCLWQAQRLRRPEGPAAEDAGQEPGEPDHDSTYEGEHQRSYGT